jgi:hypothetical protein
MSEPAGKTYSKGRWMIERERCQIEGFKPPMSDPGGVTMAAGVENVLKRMGLVHAAWAAEIVDAWPSIAGKQLARHTRPGTLQGSELTVYVDSSVWLNELQRYGIATLLGNVQEYAGADKVRRVRLQLDPDGGR